MILQYRRPASHIVAVFYFHSVHSYSYIAIENNDKLMKRALDRVDERATSIYNGCKDAFGETRDLLNKAENNAKEEIEITMRNGRSQVSV